LDRRSARHVSCALEGFTFSRFLMRHIFDRWLSTQAALPSGLFAPLIGRWLESENRELNQAALRLLAAQPHEHLLEVGCGPGWTLARLAADGAQPLTAVDPSPAMVRRALRRSRPLRALAAAGALDIRCATAETLPFPAGSFDAALAVHVLYFWRPALLALRELRRVLRPGGRLVLAAGEPERLAAVGASEATGFTVPSSSAVIALCTEAGFDGVTRTTVDSDGGYCVLASRV
jgi:SAM-dependent methyltransferase